MAKIDVKVTSNKAEYEKALDAVAGKNRQRGKRDFRLREVDYRWQ